MALKLAWNPLSLTRRRNYYIGMHNVTNAALRDSIWLGIPFLYQQAVNTSRMLNLTGFKRVCSHVTCQKMLFDGL